MLSSTIFRSQYPVFKVPRGRSVRAVVAARGLIIGTSAPRVGENPRRHSSYTTPRSRSLLMMPIHQQMPSSQSYSLHSMLQAITHRGFLNATPDNLKSPTVEVHRPLDATFVEPAGRFASKASKGRLTLPPSRTHALQAPAAASQLERNAPWPTASSPDHTFDPRTRSLNPASTATKPQTKKSPAQKHGAPMF